MNIVQHNCVTFWTPQELELRRQITPSAINRHVVVEGIAATILQCNQTRMRLCANQIRVGDADGIRTGIILKRTKNLLLAPTDTITIRLVESQNRLSKLAARKLAKPIARESGKLNLWLACETQNHSSRESA